MASHPGYSIADVNATYSPNRGLGSVSDAASDAHIDVMASAGFAQDVWTGVVSSTGPTDLDYTGPDSVAQTYTLTAATTAAGVLAQIGVVEDADDTGATTFLSDYNVTASGTTLVATAKDPSIVGTLVDSTNLDWTHTTTASEGSDLPLARAVRYIGAGTGPGGQSVAKAGLLSELGYQVLTGTVVYAASAAYNSAIVLKNWKNGEDHLLPTVVVVGNTDTATTRADLVTQLNTDLPANTFLAASGSGGEFTLTAEVRGLVASVRASSTVEAGTFSYAYTTGSPGDPAYDANAAVLGFIEQSTSIVLVSDSPVLEKRRVGPVLRGPGIMRVSPSDSPTEGGAVWLNTGTSTPGRPAGAAGADLAPISRDKMRWGDDEGSYYNLIITSRLG